MHPLIMKPLTIMSTALMGMILTSCGGAEDVVQTPTEPITAVETLIDSRVMSSGKLKGQFINAGKKSPVVLIVPGSGPTDLDGNNPMGVSANAYKMLAEALARKGISTVRVDKRGMFSSGEAGDPNAVTVDIYAEDYRNWAKTIKSETGQTCVYMLGHSEGGVMVSAASVDNEDVCGLILVSAPGRTMGAVLREQLKANPANAFLLKQAYSAIDSLEKGEKVDASKLHAALQPLFNPSVQDFLISVMKIDPATLAKSAETKTLIVQGSHDIQVSVEDARLLAEATGGRLAIIDGVNHILKKSPKNRLGNMMTYKNPDLPISTEVVDEISEFILE